MALKPHGEMVNISVTLSKAQWLQITRLAASWGVSHSAIVGEAIDSLLPLPKHAAMTPKEAHKASKGVSWDEGWD